MDILRSAKAWMALVMGLLTAAVQYAPFLPSGSAGGVAIAGAFATALAVWLVANKTHGFNVNEIADALIDAGFDAIEDNEETPLE